MSRDAKKVVLVLAAMALGLVLVIVGQRGITRAEARERAADAKAFQERFVRERSADSTAMADWSYLWAVAESDHLNQRPFQDRGALEFARLAFEFDSVSYALLLDEYVTDGVVRQSLRIESIRDDNYYPRGLVRLYGSRQGKAYPRGEWQGLGVAGGEVDRDYFRAMIRQAARFYAARRASNVAAIQTALAAHGSVRVWADYVGHYGYSVEKTASGEIRFRVYRKYDWGSTPLCEIIDTNFDQQEEGGLCAPWGDPFLRAAVAEIGAALREGAHRPEFGKR